MRWADPSDGIPLRFKGGFVASGKIFVDQKPVAGSRVRLQAGEHLLCIELSDFVDAPEASLFAWHTHRDVPSSEVNSDTMTLIDCSTAADNSWVAEVYHSDETRSETDEPNPDWIQNDFDTTNWTPLTLSNFVPAESYTDANEWRIRAAVTEHSPALNLPDEFDFNKRVVRIRKRFRLEEGDV